MENITYRKLQIEECESILDMNPYQYIKNAYREIDGKRQLIEIDYEDLDWPNGYDAHLSGLKQTILDNGIAMGAFENASGKLIGFVTVNKERFGNQFTYVLLDQLFIGLEYRNKGIGKKLFMKCVEEVRKWQVDKLYICAGSAEETIAFYFRIGCQEAIEINRVLYESDPRDIQLEFTL